MSKVSKKYFITAIQPFLKKQPLSNYLKGSLRPQKMHQPGQGAQKNTTLVQMKVNYYTFLLEIHKVTKNDFWHFFCIKLLMFTNVG